MQMTGKLARLTPNLLDFPQSDMLETINMGAAWKHVLMQVNSSDVIFYFNICFLERIFKTT